MTELFKNKQFFIINSPENTVATPRKDKQGALLFLKFVTSTRLLVNNYKKKTNSVTQDSN